LTPEQVGSRLAALRSILDRAGCAYEILAHEITLHSAEDGVAHGMGSLEEMAPTFIIKSDGSYLAAIVSGATKLSYRKLRKALGVSNVSLADPRSVLELTGSRVGTVSLVQTDLPTIVDQRLLRLADGYGGCGVPGHTLRIRVADLVRITRARVFDFTEPKG
jgi:prolyl-tRNA editing enzyme YbaK/EbsC (Cys-tRNA(Pro) deacylase)